MELVLVFACAIIGFFTAINWWLRQQARSDLAQAQKALSDARQLINDTRLALRSAKTILDTATSALAWPKKLKAALITTNGDVLPLLLVDPPLLSSDHLQTSWIYTADKEVLVDILSLQVTVNEHTYSTTPTGLTYTRLQTGDTINVTSNLYFDDLDALVAR